MAYKATSILQLDLSTDDGTYKQKGSDDFE